MASLSSASDKYERLKETEVFLVSEQERVVPTELWSGDDVVFVVWGRSMG